MCCDHYLSDCSLVHNRHSELGSPWYQRRLRDQKEQVNLEVVSKALFVCCDEGRDGFSGIP